MRAEPMEGLEIEPTPVADVRRLLREHAVSVSEIREFPHGVASRNFYACGEDGRAFAIRYDRRRSLTMVRADRAFSDQARRSGLHTPCGPWMECHADGASIVARPYLSGQALPDIARDAWPGGRRFGRMLSALHASEPPSSRRPFFYRTSYEPSSTLDASGALAACLDTDATVDTTLVRDALGRVRGIAEYRTRLRASPNSFIHGDYVPANFLLSKSRLYLIDWEKACVGPSYSDLAQALFYFGAAAPATAHAFASDFLGAYGSSHAIDVGSLRAWLFIHPAVIFLVDTASALNNRKRPRASFDDRREAYFLQQTMPRYRNYLEIEDKILSLAASPS